MARKFVRAESVRHLKLGRRRKSKRVWRRPKGRHSKMRLKRSSYPARPSIGQRTPRQFAGKVNGSIPVLVHSMRELSSVPKGSLIILARIGAKKKIELVKKAEEMSLKILNFGGKR